MAESTLAVSKSELDAAIATELGMKLGVPLTGAAGQMIDRVRKSGLRQVYRALTGDGQGTVEWSFTHPPATLNLVAGQADYDLPDDFARVDAIGPRLVYAAGSSFVSAEKVDSHSLLEARARESSSTLAGNITAGALSLVVASVRNFPVGLVPFTIRIDTEYLRVTAVSGTTFTVTRAFNSTVAASHTDGATVELLGPPKRFAIRPKAGGVSATEGQRFELLTFPTTDVNRTINYRYAIQTDDVTSALPYPLGGADHGETFLYSCLARAELMIKHEPGMMAEEFKNQLAASIVMDRQARKTEAEQFPVAPPTIGSYGWLAVELGRVMDIAANPSLWTWSEQEAVRSAINRGVLEVLKPAVTGNPRHRGHRWSFMSAFQTLTTSAPYGTGTVTIVDGVVTLAGGTWPDWAAQGTLNIAGVMYFVASRESGTQITLEDTSVDVAAGTTYTLGRERYALPSHLSALEPALFTFQAGQGYEPARIVHADDINRYRQCGWNTNYPMYVSLVTSVLNASAVTSRHIRLWPVPNAVYVMNYRVKFLPTMIDDGQFPPGGIEHANLYLAAAKAAHDPQYQQEFLAQLAGSIDQDQESHQSAPLGENADHSDESWMSYYDKERKHTRGTLFGAPYP